MTKKITWFLTIVSVIFVLSGCNDKSKEIIGAWKSASAGASGKIAIAVFGDKQMTFNGSYKSSVSYKTEGDKLVAHLDHTSWYIEFIDNDTIMVTNGNSGLGGTTKYLRTTSEDAERINAENNTKPKSQPNAWW